MELSEAEIKQFETDGYIIRRNAIDAALASTLKEEVAKALKEEEKYAASPLYKKGVVSLCPAYSKEFLKVLESRVVMDAVDGFLGRDCILHIFMSSCMPPGESNYSERIHVDNPRFIPNYTEGFGCIIPLTDLTLENGATYILPGSHLTPGPPTEEEFYKNAVRFTAKPGDVAMFHGRMWHAGGVNTTANWRYALAFGFYKPHLKQRIDMKQAMAGMDLSDVSDYVKYKLGFFNNPPATIEEYQAIRKRLGY
jgi:ectoine hydroxylase-related dioxygenase (phytanoyl-CoA dioxygenase family)